MWIVKRNFFFPLPNGQTIDYEYVYPSNLTVDEVFYYIINIRYPTVPSYVYQELKEGLEDFIEQTENTCADHVGDMCVENVLELKEQIDVDNLVGNEKTNLQNKYEEFVNYWIECFEEHEYWHTTNRSLRGRRISDAIEQKIHSAIVRSSVKYNSKWNFHQHRLNNLSNLNEESIRSAFSFLYKKDVNIQRYLLSQELRHTRELEELFHQFQEHVHHNISTNHETIHQNIHKNSHKEIINEMIKEQIEITEIKEAEFNSRIEHLIEEQKREFHEILLRLYEDMVVFNKPSKDIVNMKNVNSFAQLKPSTDSSTTPMNSEYSFTVQLGSQMKTMHNIKLTKIQFIDLLRLQKQNVSNLFEINPERLMTTMNIFSDSLTGIAILEKSFSTDVVEKNSNEEIFRRIVRSRTDYLFPLYDQQMKRIQEYMTTINASKEKNMSNIGNVYVTKHGNLDGTHVVFHVITNDMLSSTANKGQYMNYRIKNDGLSTNMKIAAHISRHPTLTHGIRHVLKACNYYQIRNVYLPLLMVDELTEDMTLQWVLKRAETVLKCVKGFLIQLGAWSTSTDAISSKFSMSNSSVSSFINLHFLVPNNMLNETLMEIADLIPSIFRITRNIILVR
ncbi:hypothetical protein SNEBB_011371 [Seison nebaliae]|nr:hypothetical protein SNEBB_011371 [Seison nebaliae]